MCMSIVLECVASSAYRGRNRVSDPLKMEWLGSSIWVLGTKLRSCARLNKWLSDLYCHMYKITFK